MRQVKFHKACTNRKSSRSASDHTKLRHLSLLVLSCCAHFGTIKVQPTSGCPGADETFLSRAMKNDWAQKCLLVLLVSTLLNVGHIIPHHSLSMKYWNNYPLGKTLQAAAFKGNCKYSINDKTQAFLSVLCNKEKICESGRCQDQIEKFINKSFFFFFALNQGLKHSEYSHWKEKENWQICPSCFPLSPPKTTDLHYKKVVWD